MGSAVCPLIIFNCLDDIDVEDINSFVLKLLPQSFFFKGIQLNLKLIEQQIKSYQTINDIDWGNYLNANQNFIIFKTI